MKKTLFTFLILCAPLLFSQEQEKKSPKLIKVPLSFLPSNEPDGSSSKKVPQKEAKEEARKTTHKKDAKNRRKHRIKKKKFKYLINTWEPYWVSAKEIEEERYLFFETNIGVGFLYFSDVKGNLGGLNSSQALENGSNPFQGRLRYNKTPLFEFLLGYQFKPYVSGAISYQHQNAVTISTKFIDSQNVPSRGAVISNAQSLFRSQFAIDAFMLKGFVEFPWPMIWKMAAFSPYVGAGIGIGWQSWMRNELDLMETLAGANLTGYRADQFLLKSKYCANFIWGADAGFKIQSAYPNNHFCIRLGCKYNQWGQARNIGKLSQQGPTKIGLFKPFKVKTVYSFAPYLGFQWNIENSSFNLPPEKIGGRSVDTWKPYFADSEQLQLPRAIFAQFTGGLGLLYFAGLKGNLIMNPQTTYFGYGECPPKYSMRYNRTPVIEYIFGFRVSPWIKVGFSKQYQSNIFVQTKLKPNINTNANFNGSSAFVANLNLLAGALKVYVEIPKSLIWKNLAYNLYVAGAFGPCWQSWNRMGLAVQGQGNFPPTQSNRITGMLFPLRSKVIPNPYFMADAGIKVKNARFDVNFYMVGGCKYSYWGAARNLGDRLQQYPSYRQGLFKPFTIQTLYSFAPYLGVQWDFGSAYRYTHKKPYTFDGRETNVFIPFMTDVKELYANRPYYTQVNTGIGFLYFERVRSNFGGAPVNGNMNIYGEYAYSDTPGYNRTPLFEFLVGRRMLTWLNVALSYYYQGGVAISTPIINPTVSPPAGGSLSNTHARFLSNFRADAILVKCYFKSPWGFVWMRTVSRPYVAVGIGPGWQSWTRIDVQRVGVINNSNTTIQSVQPLGQKISVNAVWTIDIGIKTCAAYPDSKISSTLGIKFVDWGQARSMGQEGQLSGSRNFLLQPFRVRMVYSFAPYFGIQWNF